MRPKALAKQVLCETAHSNKGQTVCISNKSEMWCMMCVKIVYEIHISAPYQSVYQLAIGLSIHKVQHTSANKYKTIS